jgi:hypothetical protein
MANKDEKELREMGLWGKKFTYFSQVTGKMEIFTMVHPSRMPEGTRLHFSFCMERKIKVSVGPYPPSKSPPDICI